MSHLCAVCLNSTTQFNYGARCCNACKMFFRRVLVTKRKFSCQFNNSCFTGPNLNLTCRQCRLQRCLEVGMSSKLLMEYQLSKKLDNLSNAINSLSILDNHCSKITSNYHISENLGFDQCFKIPSFKFVIRPENLQYTAFDWGALEQVITIDFLRKLDFVQKLDSLDQKIFIKDCYHKISILRVAMACFSRNQDFLTFPNGVGILPVGVEESSRFSPRLIHNMRTRLVSRFIELRITKEEFLLINAVIVCNPGIPDLSENARTIISLAQQSYSSHLLQYCLINYQQNGPSRFTDLLSLITVMNANMEDRKTFFILMNFHGPAPQLMHLVQDSVRHLCKS